MYNNQFNSKKNKYGATKVILDDGTKFDSKAEYQRYLALKLMQRANEISDLTLQPKFQIFPSYKNKSGKKIQAIHYIADFQYIDKTGLLVVEDVKGVETPVFKLKDKMFGYLIAMERNDIEFRIVK